MKSWFLVLFLLLLNLSHIKSDEESDEESSATESSQESEEETVVSTQLTEETTTTDDEKLTTTEKGFGGFFSQFSKKKKSKPSTTTTTTTTSRPETTQKNFAEKLKEYSEQYEKYSKVRKEKIEEGKKRIEQFRTNVRAGAKKIAETLRLNEWLKKLDIRNYTQFLPFYDSYKTLFRKYYKGNEEKARMSLFRRAIERIKEHNKNIKAKYQQGINDLSDMSWKEIIKNKLGFRLETDKPLRASAPIPPVSDMPEAWDWRDYGILTEPRNQGTCGSCWSFAAATVLESHNMKRQIAKGVFNPEKQLKISEQNLIDCSTDFGTIGCDGGMPQQAFRYVAKNGVNDVDSYPYLGKKGMCRYNSKKKLDVVVSEPKRLRSGVDEDLATAIYNYGPIAIAVHVTPDLTHYKSGLFDDPKCDAKLVNHAVVAVGYSKDFFVIRNSWGPRWGEGGYFRVSRSKVNNCGVSQQGYFPILPDAVDTKDMRDKFKPK